jgi:D-arginine dehydrogenase
MSGTADFAIIGAGMAGASLAWHLAREASVILLEQESQPGYHSTGRSAAMFTETYGPPAIRALTRASRAFLEHPPEGFATHPLLTPRGALAIAKAEKQAALEAFYQAGAAHGAVVRFSAAETLAMVPVIRPEFAEGAIYEPGAMDMDVHALHQGYLRGAAAAGLTLWCDAPLTGLHRDGAHWCLATPKGEIRARTVINAAGAWADSVAGLAGAKPVGLVPKRRTALLFDPPSGLDITSWPLVDEVDQEFYFKPDAGRLFGSPADETPVEPCDVQPEEYDLALAAWRIEEATTLPIRRLAAKWAGLRSFVADGVPVAGFDPDVPGFFWLAGQGGYGIQTADGMARLATSQLLHRPLPEDLKEQGVIAADLRPGR